MAATAAAAAMAVGTAAEAGTAAVAAVVAVAEAGVAGADPRGRLADPRGAAGPGRAAGSDTAAEGALADARARLAAGQAALLAALVAAGPDPEGFDHGALDATRRALLDKRRADVARRWPALAAEPDFATLFVAWASGRPPEGSHADGQAFALAHRARLGLDARCELLYARGAQRRLVVLVDRGDGGTLVALRAPVLGTVILRSPLRAVDRGHSRP